VGKCKWKVDGRCCAPVPSAYDHQDEYGDAGCTDDCEAFDDGAYDRAVDALEGVVVAHCADLLTTATALEAWDKKKIFTKTVAEIRLAAKELADAIAAVRAAGGAK